MLDKKTKILIVGLGLLGGSYAQSLSRQGYSVSAITKEKASIDFALEKGYIEKGTVEVDEQLIKSADLIVFALYPSVFLEWIEEHGHLIEKGTLITDVTGVKGAVVKRVQAALPEGVEFIAAHPMAGREVNGVENADETIFHGANYIVVPTEKNSVRGIETCRSLGETLGFNSVSELSVEKHDKMIAFLSQLTHCLAITLMCCEGSPDLVKYTGDSFRDLTRIANINDKMWSELFVLNKDALLSEMDRFRNSFEELYEYIKTDNRDAMRALMRVSTERRRRFNKK